MTLIGYPMMYGQACVGLGLLDGLPHMAEIAIAWVTARPAVAATILGARTTRQLEANLRAAGLDLTAQERAELDAVSDPGASDCPYGELGLEQRSRSLADGR